jgi:nucleoside-diphosphate-sugar epimerase
MLRRTTSRVVVIGGSGHIGSYLIPLLVERAYHVINVSRGTASPYHPHLAWKQVEQVKIDRKAEEAEGKFGSRIAELRPDIVVDLITYELDSAKQLVEALKGKVEHYLFCSTLWVYGHLTTVPATEVEPTNAIDDYGRKKAEIEAFLMNLARRGAFPATSFRPGHIVGEGWAPINPQGNLNTGVFSTIARGDELALPNLGLEMLHHVHADDVARWILCAIDHRAASIGECFNNVSAQSLTMRGYAEAMFRYFNKQPRLSYLPLEKWHPDLTDDDVTTTRNHTTHSPCASIEKSRRELGYTPRYTSLEAIQESVRALIKSGKVTVPEPEQG